MQKKKRCRAGHLTDNRAEKGCLIQEMGEAKRAERRRSRETKQQCIREQLTEKML